MLYVKTRLVIFRIPDDYIDKSRYPLFMARAVMRELVASLQPSRRPIP